MRQTVVCVAVPHFALAVATEGASRAKAPVLVADGIVSGLG